MVTAAVVSSDQNNIQFTICLQGISWTRHALSLYVCVCAYLSLSICLSVSVFQERNLLASKSHLSSFTSHNPTFYDQMEKNVLVQFTATERLLEERVRRGREREGKGMTRIRKGRLREGEEHKGEEDRSLGGRGRTGGRSLHRRCLSAN